MVDVLLGDYEKTGMIDERREFLIKNAAGQIYGGMYQLSINCSHSISPFALGGVETVS